MKLLDANLAVALKRVEKWVGSHTITAILLRVLFPFGILRSWTPPPPSLGRAGGARPTTPMTVRGPSDLQAIRYWAFTVARNTLRPRDEVGGLPTDTAIDSAQRASTSVDISLSDVSRLTLAIIADIG